MKMSTLIIKQYPERQNFITLIKSIKKSSFYFSIVIFCCFAFLNSSVEAKVDCIEIIKHKRELNLIENDKIIKTYKISLGKQPKGRKRQKDDGRTPEGYYFIKRKIDKAPHHRYLQISYPNPEDRTQAKIRGDDPGGDVYIQGVHWTFSYLPNFMLKMQRWYDWTSGGIALTNDEINDIYDQVDVGTPVIIFA